MANPYLKRTIMEVLENQILEFARRTPNRTFVLYPSLVIGARLLSGHRRTEFAWQYLPLLAWGYLQYRFCGAYRRRLGGGGPGIQVPPKELVTTGPYALVRNPIYLGHLIFLFGLALFARSLVGLALAVANAWWFNQRVESEERRLAEQFGEPYLRYRARVRRWIPALLLAWGRLVQYNETETGAEVAQR